MMYRFDQPRLAAIVFHYAIPDMSDRAYRENDIQAIVELHQLPATIFEH